jgi:Putative auto-transporter adhesin, head GIN domain
MGGKMLKFFLFAGCALVITAANTEAAERRYSVRGVSALAVTGVNATIVVGPEASLVLSGDRRDLNKVEVAVENGELRLKPYTSSVFNWKSKLLDKVSIQITVTRLTNVSIAGAGNVTASGIKSKYFDVAVGGGGTFTGLDSEVGNIEMSIGDSGSITMSGTCNRADISIGGSANIQAAELKCADTHINTTNGGNVEAYASRSAEIVTVRGGSITVHGNPAKRQTQNVQGGTVSYALN